MRCRLAGLWIMRMPRSISRVRPMVASCPHSGSAVYFATTSGSLQIQSFGVRASGNFRLYAPNIRFASSLLRPVSPRRSFSSPHRARPAASTGAGCQPVPQMTAARSPASG